MSSMSCVTINTLVAVVREQRRRTRCTQRLTVNIL